MLICCKWILIRLFW